MLVGPENVHNNNLFKLNQNLMCNVCLKIKIYRFKIKILKIRINKQKQYFR